MIKAFPVNGEGKVNGPARYFDNIHWETMNRNPRMRWIKSPDDEQTASAKDKKDGDAVLEINNNPSHEFLAKEAIELIDRLEEVADIQKFLSGEERSSVLTASQKRIKQIEE